MPRCDLQCEDMNNEATTMRAIEPEKTATIVMVTMLAISSGEPKTRIPSVGL